MRSKEAVGQTIGTIKATPRNYITQIGATVDQTLFPVKGTPNKSGTSIGDSMVQTTASKASVRSTI